MKQFAALARVSSREQEREGFSLEVQEEGLKRYAAQAGGEIVKLFKIAETASKGRRVFQEILALRTEVEHALLGLGKRAPNARLALNLLYRQPIVSAADLEKALHVSTPTANALIRDLERLGILVETSGQLRGRVYEFQRYLKLFVS